jgi:type II secretory pathway component HofQ
MITIADGETIAIGGLDRRQDNLTTRKVPYLHTIPIIGPLFETRVDSYQNADLTIFVTARILHDWPAP